MSQPQLAAYDRNPLNEPHWVRTVYLAGPMRGYDLYNFPAFDKYQKQLEDQGYRVISPADLDRKAGFSEFTVHNVTPDMLREMIMRDIKHIIEEVDCLALMPGWEKSSGVKVEKALAEFLHIPVFVL